MENATLLFAGDPRLFPFKHHDGMFEVAVPVRNATFQFQPAGRRCKISISTSILSTTVCG